MNKGLFKTLFDKKGDHCLENYFTEIVAAVFHQNPDILYAWLMKIGALTAHPMGSESPHIVTQSKHDHNKPDMKITFQAQEGSVLIFVESKTSYGPGLHDHQLERYAALLNSDLFTDQKRYLLFVSRVHEPVDEAAIRKEFPEERGCFIPTKWNDFYHLLKTFSQDSLACEVVQFMKDIDMAYDDRFTKEDISALDAMPKLFGLMQNCLSSEVQARYRTLTGNRRVQGKYVPEESRYILLHKRDNWFLQVGFYFGEDDSGPRVALELYINPSSYRSKFIPVLKELLQLDGWEPYDWDGNEESSIEPDSAACAFHSVELNTLLSNENNLAQINDYFIRRMAEFAEIKNKKEYKRLPW